MGVQGVKRYGNIYTYAWSNSRREKKTGRRAIRQLPGAGENEDRFSYAHSGHDSFFVKTE